MPATRPFAVIRTVDGELPVDKMRTMEEIVASSLSRHRSVAALMVGAAAIMLLITTAGLYGTTAYAARRRTDLLGLTMAPRSRLIRFLFLASEGLVLTFAGLMMGLLGTFFLTRLLASLLFGVSPTDPASLAVVALLMLTAGISATLVPAIRATRVDPGRSLRRE